MKKFLPKLKNNTSGFTLIELMVVVTIIAFLSVIGVAAFSNAQKQARDGRRRADIDAIATAMESNRTGAPGSETYPTYGPSIFANNQQPFDPVDTAKSGNAIAYGGNSYQYVVTVNASDPKFIACARLEKGNGNSSSETSIVTTGTLNFYCRAAQQ
ncbi:type II secretion system protein [Candidatus Daviesbacteria bacterium]|nr:type II secretion system protein [Candidatus Daviesbacteria bacterium]